MKQNLKVVFLTLTSVLALAGCGAQPSTSSSEQPPQPSESSVEEPEPSSIDPNQEVLDEGNTEISFNEIENLVAINQKAQDYIDKMHEQEEMSAHPYRFSGLDSIDEVEVKNLISQNDSNKKNRKIVISWDPGNETLDGCKLRLSEDWKFEEYEEYDIENNKCELDNLKRAQVYYYRLANDDESILSQVEKFETADYVRSINFDGADDLGETIYNVRDEGGYMTSYGVRTNQGLIYRGSEINDEKFGQHKKNVDDIVLAKQEKTLKIGLELDLRKEDSVSNNNLKNISGLGADVEYVRYPFTSYANFIKDPDNGTPGTLKNAFECFAKADEQHVYFHCWGGADRTGALGLFLNGILGVSLTDLYIDFELTSQWNGYRSHLTANGSYDMPAMLKAIRALPYYSDDKTINEVCEEFLIEHGVEKDTIERVREIMIPGYETGMEPVVDNL